MRGDIGQYGITHTIRTISPLTKSAAAMDMIVPSRTTRHDGGIIAKKLARIASDF